MSEITRFALGALVRDLGGELLGEAAITISDIRTLSTAGPNDISFLTNSKYRHQLLSTRAAIAKPFWLPGPGCWWR